MFLVTSEEQGTVTQTNFNSRLGSSDSVTASTSQLFHGIQSDLSPSTSSTENSIADVDSSSIN